ncbi:major facilitator superfamily transporter [Diplocarpon rosae]|nr:major facilitator superfamily transporter [Diplocarpon rosae]
MAAPVDPATRKRVLQVVFVSLLLDLVRILLGHYTLPGASAESASRSALHLSYRYSHPCWRIIEMVGGLSEGNVQLAIAMATDVSDEKQRGATMALVGICFSISFTFGPALGAWLSTISSVKANPFATAAGFSLFLIVTETLYLYFCLPETLPSKVASARRNGAPAATPGATQPATREPPTKVLSSESTSVARKHVRTNSHLLLNLTHLGFILFFSGMEFSLPFMTYDLFGYTSARNGRLLGYMGLVASLLQGGVTRRLPPLLSVRIGVVSCLFALLLLARIDTVGGLYAATTLLAVTTATVVTGLNALSSFEAGEDERGGKLGNLRSWGQLGRGIGPLLFTSVYWWAGREIAYTIGGMGVLGVSTVVFFGLETPSGAEGKKIQDVKRSDAVAL